MDISSADFFGGNVSSYLLGESKSRGSVLSEQRCVFSNGAALPFPIYTCVRKDVESETALDWMPDGASKCCLVCGKEWESKSFFSSRARHHCRSCGRLVCGECSKNRAVIGPVYPEPFRGDSVAVPTSEGGQDTASTKSSAAAGSSKGASSTMKSQPTVRVCDECWKNKRYRTTTRKSAKNWFVKWTSCRLVVAPRECESNNSSSTVRWQWWEFNAFEVGPLSPSSYRSHNGGDRSSSGGGSAITLGPACPTWAFGREFHDGVSLGVAPGGEPSFGLLLGKLCSSFQTTMYGESSFTLISYCVIAISPSLVATWLVGVFGAAFNATVEQVFLELAPGVPSSMRPTLATLADKYHGDHLFNPAAFHDYRRISPRLPPCPPGRASILTAAGGSVRCGGVGEWPCLACTFVNSALLSECEMCDAARPSAKVKPPSRLGNGNADSSGVGGGGDGGRQSAFQRATVLSVGQHQEAKDDEEPPVIALTDAGLDMNFPLLPLLRPERAVDVHVVLDFSQYDPGSFARSEEWVKVQEFCVRNRIPFPSFSHEALVGAPCTVFSGDESGAPSIIVVHQHVPEEARSKGEFSPLANAKVGGYCDLATLKYETEQFDELFAFGLRRFEEALPVIRAGLRDAQRLKHFVAGGE